MPVIHCRFSFKGASGGNTCRMPPNPVTLETENPMKILIAAILVYTACAFGLTIEQAEYFFDSDPGAGNGQPLTLVPGSVAAIDGSISLTGLTPGTHRLYVRCRDAGGTWSATQCAVVHRPPLAGTQVLAGAEYFLSSDPGEGLGTALRPADGVWDSARETIVDTLRGLPYGRTVIGFRCRDERGLWSATVLDTVLVVPVLTIQPGSAAGDIVLTWTAGRSGATTLVQRSVAASGPFATIATVTDTSYTDTGAATARPGGFYQVRVSGE
jgi:hypothetical protein